MPTDTLEQAIALLETGDLDGARALARPLLLEHDSRADGMYVLARAYQTENKPHLALYLFEETAARVYPPDTGEHLESCRAQVEASGWAEDFHDRGHTVCSACRLYYRAEYESCPYCSPAPPEEPADNDYRELIGNEELGWEDDLLDKAERAGRDVVERAKQLADSKSVKEMGERASALAKEAADKAKAFAEREDVRKAAQKAKELGREAGDSVRKVLDAETAKGVQETARETGKSFAQHVQAFIDEEQARYKAADDSGKRNIVIKWVLIGIAGLVALRLAAWIL